MFKSEVKDLGSVSLPAFTGTRVMMQPFRLDRVAWSLPNLRPWVDTICSLLSRLDELVTGVGYLTIDEAEVAAGETHRRPGLHVDGVGPDGDVGGWGGGGGAWSSCGMIVAASHDGCQAWRQNFEGSPGRDGDCSHLASQLEDDALVRMCGGRAYWCSPLMVHASLALTQTTRRQFMRISMPSTAPWYEGYTLSPVGVMPTGPVHARRAGMSYR